VTGSLHSIFHSTAFTLSRDIVIGGVLLFWFGLAFWTFRDARRRIDDPWLVGTATLLGLVPFVGPLAYLLFRPPESLEDAHARRVEVRALEARLDRVEPRCPVCRTGIEPAYLVCPVCTTQLKEPCAACKAPLEPLWQVCPYCMTPAGAVAVDLDAALSAEAAVAAPKRRRTSNRRAAAS
jgi:double zinc ribbon protein